MALAILDGTQTATTLSTILSSGQHITAHTVVSLGTQAKTDILSAVSSGIAISGTVTVGNSVNINSLPAIRINPNYDGQSGNNGPVVEADSSFGSDPRYMVVAGGFNNTSQEFRALTFGSGNTLLVGGTVTVGSALPAGTNSIGVVTIGAGTVTIGAGTAQIGTVTASNTNLNRLVQDGDATGTFGVPIAYAQLAAGQLDYFKEVSQINGLPIKNERTTIGDIVPFTIAGSVTANPTGTQTIAGSVTASISGTVPVSISSVTVGNSVTIGSLPAISGTVTASLAISSTAITSGSFSSLTSATLVPANTARKMATVYNLGAGQLFVNQGASATTLGGGFMVALSSGDFYECDYTTTTLSAIFATAGTASWVSH